MKQPADSKIAKRKFNAFKRKVNKRFSKAKTQMTSDGKFYVSDGLGGTVGDDLFIPPQASVWDAWYWASRSVQINQNFRRTHPLRKETAIDEKKFNRVSLRNRRRK
jgi:hypothetical protein